MNMISKPRVIECIAKENYDNFCNAIMETKMLRREKTIAIFGAGILGMQFANTLQSLEISNFVFCDNDINKWGRMISNAPIFSPSVIFQQSDTFFVYLAIEDYYECLKMLINNGYQLGYNLFNLTNCSELRLIEDYEQNFGAEVLILGDCTTTTISLNDEKKLSLKDLLYKKNEVKVMAMNGLYMRAFYNLFLLNLNDMHALRKVVVLLNLDIFGNKYHLLCKNQHEIVFEKMYKKFKGKNSEIADFINTMQERRKNTYIFNYVSPNRDENLSESKIEQGRRNHLKLNYLYELQEDNESMQYLGKMVEECIKRNILPCFVVMPVNWELGELYFKDDFYERYNKIRDVICECIVSRKGTVLDMSYQLTQDDFISLRSTNEGIKEDGRNKIAQAIINFLGDK